MWLKSIIPKPMKTVKKHRMNKVAVIGAGSWGTSLALLLAEKSLKVSLWGHRSDHVKALRHDRENRAYLPGFPIPAHIQLTTSIAQAVQDAGVVLMVVPSHGYRDVFKQVIGQTAGRTIYVSAANPGHEISSEKD